MDSIFLLLFTISSFKKDIREDFIFYLKARITLEKSLEDK